MFKKLIFDYARRAKSISYGKKRNRKDILGVCLHYTGNRGDTAKNNCDFFATGNTRSAGAHIFISADGSSGRSIPLNRIAWSVGNPNGAYKPGAYNHILNNANTVSIELCDMVDHGITEEQYQTLVMILNWLKKKCPNIRYIVRHYDVVQKSCPEFYVKNQSEWLKLQARLIKDTDIVR